MSAGMPKSDRLDTKVSINAAFMPGRISGKVVVRETVELVAPDIRAASPRLPGTCRIAAESTKQAIGQECTVNKKMTPVPPKIENVWSIPSCDSTWLAGPL